MLLDTLEQEISKFKECHSMLDINALVSLIVLVTERDFILERLYTSAFWRSYPPTFMCRISFSQGLLVALLDSRGFWLSHAEHVVGIQLICLWKDRDDDMKRKQSKGHLNTVFTIKEIAVLFEGSVMWFLNQYLIISISSTMVRWTC